MIDQAPLPAIDEDSAEFWQGTAAGELRVQACAVCKRRRFPPRPMCPWCRSTDATWAAMSGRGAVWSFVVPHPPLLPAFEPLAPYNVVVVSLEEDDTIRLVGNLVPSPGGAINQIHPGTISIGMRVKVVFQDAGQGIVLPRWIPDE